MRPNLGASPLVRDRISVHLPEEWSHTLALVRADSGAASDRLLEIEPAPESPRVARAPPPTRDGFVRRSGTCPQRGRQSRCPDDDGEGAVVFGVPGSGSWRLPGTSVVSVGGEAAADGRPDSTSGKFR